MGGTSLLTTEAIDQFEKMIYLPMLLTILDRDAKVFEEIPVKFNLPYLSVITRATEIVHSDLTSTHLYFKQHKLKLVNEGNDGVFTSYLFIIDYEQYRRRYLNVRLRNHSEELLKVYLERQK
ncbi:hypothetical protein NCCP2716_28010 [Sporosarcina sp. NCCP-2716]|uniref:hypothetical protein n=1 Tax=Sporosarcina sp. NCCP-2716 TaxID=2943679 RepID=UPI00203ED28B|nr:hypothetical protein [Sporosarcina sp. NCCP-2716]GKV70303.1 hypothetical protein NCCP2716_28010 [Sporosarcina sp. NCCP-2716]